MRPSEWNKDRWEWMKAVMASPDLNHTAKILAVALAQLFANHKSGECRPGLAALTDAIASPKRTVMRALSDLKEAGWIVAAGGNAPGRAAAYSFRWPDHSSEQVPNPAPEQVPNPAPEQVPIPASTGAKSCIPPCTPYKDKPQMNQSGARNLLDQIVGPERPEIVTKLVAPDSPMAARWDAWLASEGHPALAEIGIEYDGQWVMPMTVPADKYDKMPRDIAVRWVDYLLRRKR